MWEKVTHVLFLQKKFSHEVPRNTTNDYDEDKADHINIEEDFLESEWKNLKCNQICCHGLHSLVERQKKGDFVLNTEHKKVNRQTREPEKDCRDITEEKLMELLQGRTYAEVQSFARSLGAQPKGSKLDVIMTFHLQRSRNVPESLQ